MGVHTRKPRRGEDNAAAGSSPVAGSRPSGFERQLAAYVDDMADGIAVHSAIRDGDGRIVDFLVDYANAAISRITRLSHEDLVGHRILDLFPERRANGVFESYVRVVETGEPILRETPTGKRPAGRSDPEGLGADFDIRVSKLGDGYAVCLHDVRARRKADSELFDSQEMLRAVLDTIPERVFWKDRRSRLVGSNASFAHDAGWSDPSDLIGKTDHDMPWRADGDRFSADDRTVMETGAPKLLYDEQQPRPDGSVHWIRSSKVPLRDRTGVVSGILGTYDDITDLRKAQDELFESQQKLRLVLDTIPQRVFWKDRNFAFAGANATFVRYVNLSDESALIGKTDYDMNTSPTADKYRADDRQVVDSGEPMLAYEERNTRPDGSEGWIRTSKVPLRDRAGNVVGLLGTFEDITDSKMAEETLRQNERLLDSIIENIPDMVFVKDAHDLHAVVVNRAEAALLGYTKEELLHGDDHTLAVPEEVAFFESIDRQVLETGQIVDIPEEPLTRRDGTTRLLHTRKIPILDDEGRARYLLGISEDITDRKESEEARRDSEERYRHIIESITDYIVNVKIEHGRAVHVTHGPGCVAVTGYSQEELNSDPDLWGSLVVPEDRELVEQSERKVLAGERVGQIEHRLRRKDGSIRWVRHTTALRFDLSGRAIAYDGLIQDTTEQRTLQDQLTQAQKMEGIGRLAGGVAHDFNNLLTAILGYVEMCRLDLPGELPADHPARLDLSEIAGAGERAASLTRQLLTFASRQMVAPVRLDLGVLVKDSLNMIGRLLGDDIEIETALDPESGTVEADAGQIQQLLVNLAVNARDAMPNGGRLVIGTGSETVDRATAMVRPGAAPGPHVLLSVTDTGEGMTDEVASHLFEPFFTTKELGKGTGLGLATCHGIVRQMGGHIDVVSELGHGTTFRVYLPRKPGPPDPVPTLPAPVPAPAGTETLLVVEDDPRVRRLAVRGLRRRGYVVLEAANGAEALEVARTTGATIDLIVSDVMMPGMSGPELIRKLSVIAPQARALLMSGHAEATVLQQGPDLSHIFLPKPYTPERLARKVREVLDAPPAD